MDKKILIASAIISFGLLCAGFFPGYYYYHAKMDNRTVTVKGLAEREVQSDLALWNISFQVADNNILVAKQKIEAQQKLITEFLTNAGFNKKEILEQGLSTQDAYADSYRDKASISARYTLTQQLVVRTNKVNLVQSTFPEIGNLVSKGVVFKPYGNGVSYVYTKLNKIKPQMLQEATKNALAAANEFASNSGSKVGNIKSANQGVFSITAREPIPDHSDSEQINKMVRVVSTVEYFLK